MAKSITSIEQVWEIARFKPNKNQEKSIRHINGPLFLTAGPGSGKTAVLVWRTLNLIVFHGVKPEEIFLSTFTEKAAFQLNARLRTLLGIVTNTTGIPYDLAKMSIGTVHSICQAMLSDRRFSPDGKRPRAPELLDELDMYFEVSRRSFWVQLLEAGGFTADYEDYKKINKFIDDTAVGSKHSTVSNVIKLFNRFSEECFDPAILRRKNRNEEVKPYIEMYAFFLDYLANRGRFGSVGFSLLQQKALENVNTSTTASSVFKHLIVDEYQDTNTVQERLFFRLAIGSKNLCVVGDDDQALYRFRGATVENLVEFPQRCSNALGIAPIRIDLDTNYRSRKHIVDFYGHFINQTDWKKPAGKGHYRIHDKKIKPFRIDTKQAVLATEPNDAETVCEQIADFAKELIQQKKVDDPNQIAVLFPSLSNAKVAILKDAMEKNGLKVYAPRAGRFLEQEEVSQVFGLLLLIIGRPRFTEEYGQGVRDFDSWLSACLNQAKVLVKDDKHLKEFIESKKGEIADLLEDYRKISAYLDRKKIDANQPFTLELRREIAGIAGLSDRAQKTLSNKYFEKAVMKRLDEKRPFSVKYVVNRTTSLDWSILDLFYQLNGFKHFRDLYRLAERDVDCDEAPMYNLGMLTQYLSRFMDQNSPIISASFLNDDWFVRTFFQSFLYALFRREESEFENADDPFPRGRISFLTIHQAKGLEFPVVILGNPSKKEWAASPIETLVRKFTSGRDGEPLDRIGKYDNMRMFYVALSRPKNLLVIPHYIGKGTRISEPFKSMLRNDKIPRLNYTHVTELPSAEPDHDDLGKSYSFTGDYLEYVKCPRSYMVFKKFQFVPSRSQTMFFGRLVHSTIEDLHHLFYRKPKMKKLTDAEIEREIIDAFELNYELLQLEGGHAMTPDVKNSALQQVLFYWKKMREVAENVTDTEVKLTLPEQKSPENRRFVIEGVVDIVKEGEHTWMYDLKTHDADFVKANVELYEKQLNVYSHIWQNLRNQPLDHTAIIATSLPEPLYEAVRTNDEKAINRHFEDWNPLIEISCDLSKVNSTVEDFGKVVDSIENNNFTPPPASILRKKVKGDNLVFATRVCRNCDARWSCSSYREYAISGSERSTTAYRQFMSTLGSDIEVEDWKTITLESATGIGPTVEESVQPQATKLAVATKGRSLELTFGSITFEELFAYIKKVPHIPHKKETKYQPYMKLYKALVMSIPKIPGWYVWVKKTAKKTEIIYVGQSAESKSGTIHSRVKEEFLDEYVALWGTIHPTRRMVRELDDLYNGKYTKDIERSARKAGATHIIWCGAGELTTNELTTVEYRLIEELNPSANLKRLKPFAAHDAIFSSAILKIQQEIEQLG